MVMSGRWDKEEGDGEMSTIDACRLSIPTPPRQVCGGEGPGEGVEVLFLQGPSSDHEAQGVAIVTGSGWPAIREEMRYLIACPQMLER